MLALSRKVGEKIVCKIGGETMTVCIVAIENGKVRIGFEAPPSVKINRKEVQDQIDEGIPRKHALDRMKDDGCPRE